MSIPAKILIIYVTITAGDESNVKKIILQLDNILLKKLLISRREK
jgi:hypothetical protein